MTTLDSGGNTLLSAFLGDARGRMSILQCQIVAKQARPMDTTFVLVGPTGRLRCRWLDPFLGFITVEGHDGCITCTRLAMAHDLHVENVEIVKAKK